MRDTSRTIVDYTRRSDPGNPNALHQDVPETDEEQPVVPGYELLRVIGRGGMGIVWEAVEHRLERRVALKVRRAHLPTDVAGEIWFEARLAAKVADPGVVAVHDIGTTLDGRPYYTMDFVLGTDLSALLREGALPQAQALSFAAQIASALGAAHEQGIAHRDLKPANVLIDRQGRARLLDFGLAHGGRQVDRFARAVFGTPSYMSPEQVLAASVGPPADIHAIGIMLYEMLTGVRPYRGNGADEVMALIAMAAPEPPTVLRPGLHVDVERVVLRCLEKKPEARFASARQLAKALEAIIEGRPIDAVHSINPPARRPTLTGLARRRGYDRDSAPVHERWSFRLRSSPEALWPLIANTDRVNRAVGLPEVEFSDKPDEEGASHRTARSRVLGVEIAWREHPFEWTKNHEHSVFREYASGPLEALWNRVQLVRAGGETELIHEVWCVPRNVFGRLAVRWELGQKLGQNLGSLYHRIDAALVTAPEGPGSDAFDPPFEPTAAQKRMASDAKAELLAHGFSAEVVLAVIDHVLYQPTKVLERIRPYALADAWGMDRQEVLAVLLQAANRGVVDLAWDLICPRCLVSHESFPALSRIERSGVCLPCNRAYERDLRESVELVFRPHPALREAEPTTYCAGAPALRPHILAQQSLPPGEERVFRLELPSDEYRVVASHVREPFAFSVSTVAFGSELSAVIEEGLIDSRPSIVKTGTVRISIVNNTEHDQIVRVEEARGRADRVTAADVLSTPSFRDLFSQEMLAEGEHMSVSRMAFLFVDIEGRQDLLASHGDAGAWAILRTLDRELDAHAREHEGTLVASSLDARIAAFNTTLLALKAALSLTRHAAISESLKVAVHDGQCLALTRTGRTEYFGKTLHRGVALLDEATAGKVALSATAAGDRAVATYLEAEGLGREVATTLGGPYNGTRVVKVSVSAEDSVRTPAA